MASGVAADLLVHVGADVKDAIGGLNKVDNRVNKSGAGFGKAGLAMGGASLAIVGGLGAAIRSAANYEQAISNITALGGEFATSQTAIGDLALEIGQKTAFSATEGALAIAELAKAGVPLQDILAGAAMEAANLAAAGGQSIPEAAVTMSNAMNMFGIAGKDAVTVADSFAAAANASAADVHTLAMALAQGGPASAALGNSLQETNAVLALFSNYGIKGSDAGTSLKTMLQSLTNPSAEAADKMAELGINAFDAAGNFVGFEALAGQLQTSLKGLTQEQRAAALAMIFGSDASRVANVLYEEGAAGVAKMTAAVSEQGVAGEMAKAKMDNLAGAIEQLKGSFETALIIIGSMFIPVIRKLADGITGALNKFLKLPKPVQKLGGIIAAATAGFLALGAAIGIAIAFSGPLIAGLAAITAPILIIVGLIAALGFAWSTNFLGIRDATIRVKDAVVDFLDPLKTWAYFFGEAFKSGSRIRNLVIYFPKPLQEAARGFLLVADALGDIYRAFERGGFSGMLEALPTALSQIGDGLKILISEGLNKLSDAFNQIDWGAVGSALLSGLTSAIGFIGDITGPIISKLGDLTAALGGWLWDQASEVDWAGILSGAASRAKNITGKIIEKIGDLGKSLKTWYDNAIDSVDWGNMGFTVGQKVGDLTRTLAPKALQLINGFIDEIKKPELWVGIAKTLGTLIIALPATIAYLGFTLLPKAAEFIGGFVSGLGINWAAVGGWIKENFWKLPLLVPILASMLLPKAAEFLGGLLSGLIQKWPDVKEWLADVGPQALAAIGNVSATLAARGIQLLSGLWRGILNTWDTDVKPWLKDIGPKAIAAIGSLIETLTSKGNDLIDGMKTGIKNTWVNVVEADWLSQLGQFAIDAVGWLGEKLKSAGNALIQGFIDGMSNLKDAAMDTARGIAEAALDVIPDFLGIGSPSKYTIEYGRMVSQGLIVGMESMMPEIRSAMSGLHNIVDVKPSGARITPNNGAVTQNFEITLKLDELEELVEAGRFVSQLNGTRTLYKGSAFGGGSF